MEVVTQGIILFERILLCNIKHVTLSCISCIQIFNVQISSLNLYCYLSTLSWFIFQLQIKH